MIVKKFENKDTFACLGAIFVITVILTILIILHSRDTPPAKELVAEVDSSLHRSMNPSMTGKKPDFKAVDDHGMASTGKDVEGDWQIIQLPGEDFYKVERMTTTTTSTTTEDPKELERLTKVKQQLEELRKLLKLLKKSPYGDDKKASNDPEVPSSTPSSMP